MHSVQKTIAYYTLGCKLNFSETATISRNLIAQGFRKVEFTQPADVYVINTCSVTANADKECKVHVRTARKANPNGLVIVIGCYAQLKPVEISQIEGVDLVLGASEKFNIPKYLDALTKEEPTQIHACEVDAADFYVGSYSIGERTRAFLKVQDGCDYTCTYCTIPLARGISRSDTVENVLKNAAEITQKGIQEIVLTGVNIGDYGKGEFGNKKHKHTFLELLQELETVNNLKRVRISSIEPNLLSNEIIDFVAHSSVFVPHFHIPLQSGSDALLKKMKRRYLTALYSERIERIRESMPNACIGVDVIVGFPGETEEHFLTTYNFLNSLEISYLHVFTYSERDNTEAANFENVVPYAVRKQRSKMLRILSEKKRLAFYQSQLGNTADVLWENATKSGDMMQGFTPNYVKVVAPLDAALFNRITPVELALLQEDGKVLGAIKSENLV